MEWTIRLEARTGWGEVTTCEIGALRRSLDELTADGVGLGLAEAKALLAELQQRIVQSQIDLRPGLPRLPEAETATRSAHPHSPDVVRHREGRRPSHPPVHLRRYARHVRRVVVATVTCAAGPLHGGIAAAAGRVGREALFSRGDATA